MIRLKGYCDVDMVAWLASRNCDHLNREDIDGTCNLTLFVSQNCNHN